MPRDEAPEPSTCPWTVLDVLFWGTILLIGCLIVAANPPTFTVTFSVR